MPLNEKIKQKLVNENSNDGWKGKTLLSEVKIIMHYGNKFL